MYIFLFRGRDFEDDFDEDSTSFSNDDRKKYDIFGYF